MHIKKKKCFHNFVCTLSILLLLLYYILLVSRNMFHTYNKIQYSKRLGIYL